MRKDFKRGFIKRITLPTKEELAELYINQHKSISQIAKLLKVSQPLIRRLLIENGFKIRNIQESGLPKDFKEPTKEELYDLYWNKGLKIKEIAKRFGISDTSIRKLFHTHQMQFKRKIINKTPKGWWTKEKILTQIKYFYNARMDLSARYSSLKHGRLFKAALKFFGTWQKAIEAAGLDYNKILRQKQWSKEEIIGRIKELYNQRIDISYKNIRKKFRELVSAAENNFGSYAKAVNAANIDYYGEIAIAKNRYWTEQRIIDKISELHNKGIILSSRSMQLEHQDLFSVASKRFGSWEKAVEKAGFDYSEIKRTIYKYQCKDSHRVRSSYEKKVCEWLYTNGIPHVYERSLFPSRKYLEVIGNQSFFHPLASINYRKFKCDFFVGGSYTASQGKPTAFYIEILGLKGNSWYTDYYKRFEEKKKIYKRLEQTLTIKLIEIEPRDDLNKKLGFLIPLYSKKQTTLS